ncbi:MAG TPA: VOC family protein [Bryobacteraceae bacterium]|nr:VOC family protein [Bryobacteraceae bacterium]
MSKSLQKVTPFLWFDRQAEEAARFYTSVFKNSRIETVTRYGEAGPGAKGSVMTVAFELDGRKFTALNGGPLFKFTEAVSFVVHCDDQQEVDEMWEKLLAGGKESQCGWLQDKYGLSWQIVPTVLLEMLQDQDAERKERVVRAMLQMKKLDIAGLEAAYRPWPPESGVG